MIIAIHKWGFEQIFSNNKGIIIEVSVDSIILKKSKMFLNNSEFEFIVNDELLYCMRTKDIVIKYDNKKNEIKYNPSWAKSS